MNRRYAVTVRFVVEALSEIDAEGRVAARIDFEPPPVTQVGDWVIIETRPAEPDDRVIP